MGCWTGWRSSRCGWSASTNSLTPALDRRADRTGQARRGWPVRPSHDPAALEPSLTLAGDTGAIAGLDLRSRPLVRLAGLVATGAGDMPSAYRWHVAEALDRGVTVDEIAGVLMTLLPVVGTARVTAAASAIRAALDRA